MDYGQTAYQNRSSEDFFTSGAGTSDVNVNNFESNNNLDLTNASANWSVQPERNFRGTGNKTLGATEYTKEDIDAELSKIPDFAPAPIAPEAYKTMQNFNTVSSLDSNRPTRHNQFSPNERDDAKSGTNQYDYPNSQANIAPTLESSVLREEKDTISPATLEATERTVADFEKGKITPAELDDLRWEATKTYLKNSFGRELVA